MKAYRLEVFVIDFDEMGGEQIANEIENVRYPNHCISPSVKDVEEVDIGQWHDGHPLNRRETAEEEYRRMFMHDGDFTSRLILSLQAEVKKLREEVKQREKELEVTVAEVNDNWKDFVESCLASESHLLGIMGQLPENPIKYLDDVEAYRDALEDQVEQLEARETELHFLISQIYNQVKDEWGILSDMKGLLLVQMERMLNVKQEESSEEASTKEE